MNKQTVAVAKQKKAGEGLPSLLGRVLRRMLFALLAIVGSLPMLANAENAIRAVSGSVQGGSEVIRIEMAEPLATAPTGFSIQAPARIALDFQGVANAVGRSTVEVNLGNMRSANIVQSGERTRVVLNLKTPAAYTTELQGRSLLVILEAPAVASPSVAAAPVFAESRNRDTLPLKDIDFRRGPDNSGRVVVWW